MTLESSSIGVGQFGGGGVERVLLENTTNNENDDGGYVIWKVVYMSGVLIYMFVALLSDRLGADMVMVSSLALCMASEIISVKEGMAGFANEGVLTVVVLFVVAAGISLTGALDWYMGKLLGSPSTMTSAQLRLMIPITMVSAFLNNTPVVAVMIPIVQKWATTISQDQQQLLIPLSFASIFGGTCTLIGTSTNLVVLGLLQTRYPNNSAVNIGLFDLAIYGVPLAMVGMTYLLLMTPHLLSNKRNSEDNGSPVLMGAKLTQWSTAAGRSVQRSGLRDTGGIYLVSVYRATTGNVHRAVGQDFVLHQGDILYFTTAGKKLHDFGPFCDTHGLEVVTHDDVTTTTIEDGKEPMFLPEQSPLSNHKQSTIDNVTPNTPTNIAASLKSIMPTSLSTIAETTIPEDAQSEFYYEEQEEEIRHWSETKRLLLINRITDQIRNAGNNNNQDADVDAIITWGDGPPQIVVNIVSSLVVIAVNSKDRPGLLLDVSRGLLLKLNLNFHHTEASVVAGRSLSIWRCELLHPPSNKRNKKDESNTKQQEKIDLDETYSALHDLLHVDNENGGNVETVVKRRGLQVIRAEVGKQSRLVGKTLAEIPNFRSTYKAAIVSPSVGKFQAGMVVVLQAAQDSPLLQCPPANFYDIKKSSSSNSLSKMVRRFTNSTENLLSLDTTTSTTTSTTTPSQKNEHKPKTIIINDLEQQLDPAVLQKDATGTDSDSFFIGDMANDEEDVDSKQKQNTPPKVVVEEKEEEIISQETTDIWRDFKVLFPDEDSGGIGREFLTAMVITSNSNLASKSAIQSGLDKLPGVVLVSIDRTIIQEDENQSNSDVFSTTTAENHKKVQAIAPSEVLNEGDVVWYAGSASATGDLRKIPGWKSYLNEEVKKVSDKVHDRRLVQAVIARKGPLVGKTVRDVRFRTKYGAAVISINREGTRIQDFPGNIPLQGGDVLLLEAGPTFLHNQEQNYHSSAFALLAEVRDSAPPRLRLLLPALGLTITMLAVYTANLSSLLVCGLIAAGLMMLLGIISQQEARNAVNWEVYVTIASAFGIGSALTNSGVAKAVADALVKIGTGINMGDAGLYGAVYFATFLISNVVTNNAAAALLFPIAMDAAEKTNADLTKMSFSLMLGASASFMSPFGYTTNLLIYGPGGYKYVDFLKIGTPLQIVLWIVSIFLLSVNIPWYINWIAMTCLLIITSLILISKSRKKKSS